MAPDPPREDQQRSPARDRGPREWVLHLAGAIGGPAVVSALVGSTSPALIVRVGALTLALTLVGRGLVLALSAMRLEWRREPLSARQQGLLVARFGVAFLLAVVATS